MRSKLVPSHRLHRVTGPPMSRFPVAKPMRVALQVKGHCIPVASEVAVGILLHHLGPYPEGRDRADRADRTRSTTGCQMGKGCLWHDKRHKVAKGTWVARPGRPTETPSPDPPLQDPELSHLSTPRRSQFNTRPARRTSRSSNPTKLQRPRTSHKSSPLWKSPIFHSIPEWNSLPASTAEADSLLAFKSRLAAPKP